jgi:SPX domain protein involved in polyphosphate accumulation
VNNQILKNARQEIKFVASEIELQNILLWIKLHPACFVKAYDDRLINNIYFDTHQYTAYCENLSGTSTRQKVRYRWYGDEPYPDSGRLEIKHRRNFFGWKDIFASNTAPYASGNSWRDIKRNLVNNLSPEAQLVILFNPFPVIINRYKRKYFVSNNDDIRITVDTELRVYDQRYSSTPNISRQANIPKTMILEVKCDRSNGKLAASVINSLPIRVSKNSKYASAVASINTY